MAAGQGAGSDDEAMLTMKCGGAGSGGSRRRCSALPARWEGTVAAGKMTWLSSPTTEPDKQLSLASHNQPSVTVAGSRQREGELGGRVAGLYSPCLPPPARQVPPSTQGCPAGWVPPHHPGRARVGKLCWVLVEPRAGADPMRGWHPCRRHPGVVQGGCCLLQRRIGGLIRALPAWGEEWGGTWHHVAPALGSEIAADM